MADDVLVKDVAFAISKGEHRDSVYRRYSEALQQVESIVAFNRAVDAEVNRLQETEALRRSVCQAV